MTKVAMISGASRGIGLAIAKALRADGFALSLGVRQPGRVATSFVGDSPEVMAHAYEAADRDAGDTWVAATLARFGRIDVVIANAGIAPQVGFEFGSDDDLDTLFEINVKAPFRLIRAALPALKVSGSGRVVTVASLSGKRVLGLNVGYQMSKHAAIGLNHAVRRIGWEHGIRATALCPGYVATDMTSDVADFPIADMTDPADLAALVAMIVKLPNSASIAELLVNCRYETTL